MLKILFLSTSPKDRNPYIKQLTKALEDVDVEVSLSWIFPNSLWLLKNRKKYQLLHIHWPSVLYRFERLTWLRFPVVIFRFYLAKLLGYKIVWTAHNLMPHEQTTPRLDKVFRQILVTHGHGVIFHCQAAYRMFVEMFSSPRAHAFIPHGNYDGCYTRPLPKDVAREKLGLPQGGIVFLCFGKIREYKGLEHVSKMFSVLGANCHLVIVGSGSREAELRLRSVIQPENIHLNVGFVPDDEVSIYFSAADALITPYEAVTTSGTAILGLTFGLPVIAPAIGCLPELLSSGAGILYSPFEKEGLLRAIQAFLQNDKITLSRQARQVSDSLDWKLIGEQTAAFYNAVLSNV